MATFTGSITYEMLPVEARAEFDRNLNQDSFKIRLKEGGTIKFENVIMPIQTIDVTRNALAFWACDVFEMVNSKIITNGNTVVIFCNKFKGDGAEVISFPSEQKKAPNGTSGIAPGANGNLGQLGDGGGLLSIHIIQEALGRIIVDISGQNGGDGGHAMDGSNGAKGPNGRDSHTTKVGVRVGIPPIAIMECDTEAFPGGKGGTGQAGGDAGNGGNGGSGGIFQLINVGDSPIDDAFFDFTSNPGIGGVGGRAGRGGLGGPGGDGGRGSAACHGANAGPVGDIGTEGTPGVKGADGQLGQIIKRNLPLEIIIKGE